MCLGAHFVMFPGLILKTFGMRAGGQLYSILYTAYALASIMGTVVYKLTVHYLGDDQIQTVFNVSLGLILISIATIYLVFEEKPITNESEPTSELGLLNQTEDLIE